jgi:hypothetical protein
LFPLAPLHLPWDKFPPAFIKDRSTVRPFELNPNSFAQEQQFRGGPINVEAMVAQRGQSLSMLSTHLVGSPDIQRAPSANSSQSLIEEQVEYLVLRPPHPDVV